MRSASVRFEPEPRMNVISFIGGGIMELVPCTKCQEEIEVSEHPRKRRLMIPPYVRCNFCNDVYHFRCSGIPAKCSRVNNYDWECSECKHCIICKSGEAESMMFCDGCDRGCHGPCLTPPVDVDVGDETPFLCKDCVEVKHTTRGFRRTKILGCDAKKALIQKKESPAKAKRQPYRKPPRRSRSSDAEQEDSSTTEDSDVHVEPLPHTCIGKGCDGSGHLNGKDTKHYSLDTCPRYNRITHEAAETYAETLTALRTTSSRKTPSKKAIDSMEALSKLAEERMKINIRDKPAKVTEVFEAPLLKGTSGFSKTLFEMSKVNHAIAKPETDGQLKSKKFIEKIQIGPYVIEVDEMSATGRDEPLQKEVFFCDICLNLYHDNVQFSRHMASCPKENPPGMDIYAKGDLAVYEIDGRNNKEFCQNLSILSRFFLSTKAVCYDVIYMMYYVLAQRGPDGRYRPVGYFSKDKDLEKNTLACILVLPQFEQRGFGKLLIDLSYVIAKTTHKPGTPERPLSWPGLLAFTSYWKCVVSRALLNNWTKTDQFGELMESLVSQLGMAKDDIEDTFVRLDLIKTDPKTKKLMLLKQPVKEMLEQNASKFAELKTRGILIDPVFVKKPWLKLLTTRKKID
ncbi:putative Histone acetyltransferase KAT7 [Hypsibius exemplaris]|uniref:histone acetyltransferase n=1 Tax=Hypsibius exemplaris TaxID=2072580 RepID=A0A1W0XAU8_HYPEX|nr:putative Histone acetyltransferase KAT7 [Hypsibius exemplaris]